MTVAEAARCDAMRSRDEAALAAGGKAGGSAAATDAAADAAFVTAALSGAPPLGTLVPWSEEPAQPLAPSAGPPPSPHPSPRTKAANAVAHAVAMTAERNAAAAVAAAAVAGGAFVATTALAAEAAVKVPTAEGALDDEDEDDRRVVNMGELPWPDDDDDARGGGLAIKSGGGDGAGGPTATAHGASREDPYDRALRRPSEARPDAAEVAAAVAASAGRWRKAAVLPRPRRATSVQKEGRRPCPIKPPKKVPAHKPLLSAT